MPDSDSKHNTEPEPESKRPVDSKPKNLTDSDVNRPSVVSRVLNVFPPWVGDNLRSRRQTKTLIRCWVSTFASLVVILPTRSLIALGNVAFFCLLGSLMMPPNMPIQMFFYVISLIILGQLLGWALGAAAMKAAIAARSVVLLRSSYEIAQQTAATAANPDAAFRLEIFQGVFLDPRSSAVFGVMFGVFSFLFALGRAYRPRLILFFTFAQIFLDIFCTFGPLFPNTQYTILSSLLISMGVYMAIGLVTCVFIFPETMAHSYLALVTKALGDLKRYGELYGTVLELSPEEIADDSGGIVGQCVRQRLGLILTMQALKQKSALIDAEFSYGRWNGSDAKDLEEPFRIVVTRMGNFFTFPMLLSRNVQSISRATTNTGENDGDTTVLDLRNLDGIDGDTELIRQLNSRRDAAEAENNVRMSDIIPLLSKSTANLRMACLDALQAAQELMEQINSTRWKRSRQVLAEKEATLDTALERLRASSEAYKAKDRFAIIEPFLPLLRSADEDHQLRKALPLRPLVIASSFAAQLVVSIDALIDLFGLIQKTTHKRQRARLWAPSGLRAVGNFILHREKGSTMEAALGENPLPEEEEEEEQEEKPFKRDPDSRPPTNIIQKCMNGLHDVYKWTKSPQAMFGMKYAIVSVLLWLPAVLRSSANFYYVEKGVWGLIMAQTAMNVYAADSFYSIVTRSIGTFLGLVVGLLVWYIGNGNGNGNPYGVAAAYGVLVIPAMFVRINAPPALLQPVIMFNATLALIVGYSWIDANLNVVGNPGIGWPIAWKRFVLVMIGVTCAFIMSSLPPISSRKAVRLKNAKFISELSSLYSSLMSIWIAEEEADSRNDDERPEQSREIEADGKSVRPSISATVRPGWATPIRTRMLALEEQLQALQVQTATAKFEGNIRGAWPAEEYHKLLEQEGTMLSALKQLFSALQHLDPVWRASLNRRTMVLNPNFITDVMSTFALVSQSLRNGEPIHQILPTSLLDRLLYHHTHDAVALREYAVTENVSYFERASSLEFIFFSTGITAVSQVIRSLDEMHQITRRLCGEVPFRGFSVWKNDYDRAFRSV
ncbi:uncharacterized protein FOMMEDRAFT_133035 [Fomitiporia mediterranea MF3/22]|uniref:uncharacterized protein n=1 Tax=Fomitiporia mediterranea (strain MF3/22) TaxID=694068 RepID=UPI0004407398|nr:uncharacterized protein FOMMEDRAFT_133035 [Fomitiporia mediterranea MF3/22]EJD03603.1 hypothetical protein FOMMEDRAFT_133035 [Fomitiporia mediterranea MF3/22]